MQVSEKTLTDLELQQREYDSQIKKLNEKVDNLEGIIKKLNEKSTFTKVMENTSYLNTIIENFYFVCKISTGLYIYYKLSK